MLGCPLLSCAVAARRRASVSAARDSACLLPRLPGSAMAVRDCVGRWRCGIETPLSKLASGCGRRGVLVRPRGGMCADGLPVG